MPERMSDSAFEHFKKIAIKQFKYEQRVIILEAERAREAEKDWERLCDEADVLMGDMCMKIEKLGYENAELKEKIERIINGRVEHSDFKEPT